jgi:2-phosphosulfolactate phosphatase
MYFDQQEYDIRFEWGLIGLQTVAPQCEVVIIVDVLSFTTCVDIAVGRGAAVFPYNGAAADLPDFAAARNALCARPGRQHEAGFSLAPSSLINIPPDTRLVLPSPNGSTLSLAPLSLAPLSLASVGLPILAGSLRNAQAVAGYAGKLGRRIGVIAAGERWPGGLLRPALEDLLGAGAIIAHLSGSLSPEAALALAGFQQMEATIIDALQGCGSGKELIRRGFAEDVQLAGQLNVSAAVPRLIDEAYRQVS